MVEGIGPFFNFTTSCLIKNNRKGSKKSLKHLLQNDDHFITGMHSASISQWQSTTMLGTVTLVLLLIIDSYVHLQAAFPMLLTCSENFRQFTYKPNLCDINQLDLSRQTPNSSA
jgi:hypothetical protein